MESIRRIIVGEDGQALMEYGLILGLIAVACVAAVSLMGTNINSLLKSIAGSLSEAGTGTTP